MAPLGDRRTGAFRVSGHTLRARDAADRRALLQARKFVVSMFNGMRAPRPRIEWPAGSPFFMRVWKALVAVPMGKTVSYRELARRAGRVRAARAAGTACARNPLPLFIPCHRVLASGGALGGFSSGRAWKRLLLAREGAL
jgi:O-6-methylguanine DNA methyltransferase